MIGRFTTFAALIALVTGCATPSAPPADPAQVLRLLNDALLKNDLETAKKHAVAFRAQNIDPRLRELAASYQKGSWSRTMLDTRQEGQWACVVIGGSSGPRSTYTSYDLLVRRDGQWNACLDLPQEGQVTAEDAIAIAALREWGRHRQTELRLSGAALPPNTPPAP